MLDIREGFGMSKSRIIGVILGVIGVVYVGFGVMALLWTSLGSEIKHYSYSDISTLAQCTAFLAISFGLGIGALTFYNEKKSPYLLGASTIFAAVSTLPIFFDEISHHASIPVTLVLFRVTPALLLFASTLLMAYANIWRKS